VSVARFEQPEITRNPGRVDTFERDPRAHRGPHPVWTVLRFGLTCAAFIAVPLFGVFGAASPDPVHGLYAFVGLIVYAILCTAYRPEPDLTDLGWFGGLVDAPFRSSDDRNRMLLVLLLVTAPGRFLGTSVLDMFHLVAGE
jgi:hypothetical protein